ncbi:HD domain-containing protein [Clostridium sp. CTA-7]
MKKLYLKDIKQNQTVESTFMIIKILSYDLENLIAVIGDSSGEVKSYIKNIGTELKVGDVILIKGKLASKFKVNFIKKISDIDISDYLPSVKRPINEIMKELNEISEKEFKSLEAKSINEYFFNNEDFLNKFTRAIGGVFNHHNYIGGLAEHTLAVTSLARDFAYKYNCKNKEIAILGAKLHDIGKIREMNYDGPFSYTLEGELQGHIVIGLNMLDDAFNNNKEIYSENFINRLKAIVVQHHGKAEFGSPKEPNTLESYIVHYADYVDATLNKISIISEGLESGEWTEFDRRINGKIYI